VNFPKSVQLILIDQMRWNFAECFK